MSPGGITCGRRRMHDRLKKLLLPAVYRHSLGTAKTAAALAKIYGLSAGRAYTAGLLHDCAKGMNRTRLEACIKKYGIKLDAHAGKIPAVWHSYVGEKMAAYVFGIKDRAVLVAIRNHTIGRAGMSRLARIVYVSDFIEEGRRYAASRRIRKKAMAGESSLDSLVLDVVKDKEKYLKNNGLMVHPGAILLRKELMHTGNEIKS
jgi:predicted HD superfamily hydrolase involved in NAD metabolism